MKASKFTESKYLSAKVDKNEIEGKTFVIDAVFPEVINGTEKLCVRLRGLGKVLVLNQTNIVATMNAFGEDTEMWPSHSVQLNIVGIMFNGQIVDSIQVRPAK